MLLKRICRTSESIRLAILRLTIALVFLMAGLMKLIVPEMIAAFHEQLKAIDPPMIERLRLVVPIMEILIGYFLLIGLYTRIFAIAAIASMSAAMYVHILVKDPALFPLQPVQPIIPIAVIALSLVLVVFGAGAWSKDSDIFDK